MLLVAALLFGLVVPSASALEPDETSFSGTVTGADGLPAVGVSVELQRPDGEMVGYTLLTDESGRFEMTSKWEGTFTLYFRCSPHYCSGSYEPTWLGGAATVDGATTFELVPGSTVDRLDVALPVASTISGIVTDSAGQPLESVSVHAQRAADATVVSFASTNARGEFVVKSLPAGSYVLGFSGHPAYFHSLFWPDSTDAESATPLLLAAGEERTGVDATLVRTSRITGTVIDEEGSPFPYARVSVQLHRFTSDTETTIVESRFIDADGWFWFNELRAGRYAFCLERTWTSSYECTVGSPLLEEPFELLPEQHLEVNQLVPNGPVQLTGPTLGYSVSVGDTLAANASSTTTGATLTYAWLADDTPIVGANSETLTLTPAHLGAAVSVQVTASAPDRITWKGTSNATAAVELGDLHGPAPNIVGEPFVGQTLTASPGSWPTGTTLRYEWLASPMSGASITTFGQTLKLTSAYAGMDVSVSVTAEKPGYHPLTRWSDQQYISMGRLTVSTPTIAGLPAVGSTLVASAMSPDLGSHITYQWAVDGAEIPDHSSAELSVEREWLGKRISVRATVMKDLYLSKTSPYSTRTAPVGPERWAAVSRLAGADRYATSALISRSAFGAGEPITAFVASGASFPDALSGTWKAGLFEEPVLLSDPRALPKPILNELKRLDPRFIQMFGGYGALSPTVQTQLSSFGEDVYRVEGSDRFETAASMSRSEFATGESPSVVYIANGMNFPDALAAAPLAVIDFAPVLLVQRDSIPPAIAAELKRLKPKRIVILGGTGVVDGSVARELTRYVSAPVVRLAGKDRYSTSVAISKSRFAAGLEVAYIASGANFPDALSGAAVAGINDAPILLTAPESLPTNVRDELKRLHPKRIVVLGGTGAVSAKVEAQLEALEPYWN